MEKELEKELEGLRTDFDALTGELRKVEDSGFKLADIIKELATRVEKNASEVLTLKDADVERKALLFSLRTVVFELCNVLLAEHDEAVEQKVRSRVDKLKTLVNPLR